VFCCHGCCSFAVWLCVIFVVVFWSWERFLFGPQAPGAGILPLGFPRISSGARSRLPTLRVGSARPLSNVNDTHQTDAKRRQGRPAAATYWRVAKGADAPARRLRSNKKAPSPYTRSNRSTGSPR